MRRVLALTLLACALVAPAAAAAQPPAVVVDTDMDFDDAAALAYLGAADRLGMLDLRAVTVAVDGVALPGHGLATARCLLAKLGLTHVPAGDGQGERTNRFPEDFRPVLGAIVERAVGPCADVPTEGGAAALLAAAIRSAGRPVTVITLGPLSNLAQVLEDDPALVDRIERVIIQGGDTTEHAGKGHDFNLWVDAPAAQSVLGALSGRVFMTPLNAANHVPLSAAFRLRPAADRTTPAAEIAYAIASDPLIMAGEQGLAYWWDPLTAVAATTGGVVRFRLMRLRVLESGADEGRTVVDPAGAHVHFGVDADADRFHQVFLDVLNYRSPFDVTS